VTLIFTRFGLGLLPLFALLIAQRQPLLPPRREWPMLALLGFVAVFVHQLLQANALRVTTAVSTGWLIGLTPIWSAALAALFLRERFTALKILGLVIGAIGAAVVVTRGRWDAATFALPATRGDLLILASTVNWAIYSTLGHGTMRRLGSLRATPAVMLFGWLMIAPLFVREAGWHEWPGLSGSAIGAVLFLGLGCSGIAYLFWNGALERIPAGSVAAFLYLEPLVTLAAAVPLLGEEVRPATIVGGVLVLVGVWVVQRAPAES
jgi:drug/metabolite transporter (DMT)-like permease